MFCLRFLFLAHPAFSRMWANVVLLLFTDLRQTDYLNIHRADLRQICRVGRTPWSVDERPKVNFWIPQRTLPWQPIFVRFIGFYPHNLVRVPFSRWRRTTRSASAALYAGKPISWPVNNN